MKNGAGEFCKAASKVYASLPERECQRLRSRHAGTGESEDVMSNKDIMKAGAKAFKKIHNQVQ